ncbi:hypothetical protein PoB_003924200 [Plakobranchus ocellatus]|uniref:Uncharacterized protein n=1 Tax=Plakobranchus ocellatus TaxID=259542 RepID=A0AAV4B0U0_9GAST|nr:hypothetical protein PoB_003924200 [Plakobranchus ocellatus]
MGISRTIMFDMTILATCNTCSSRFLTPVLAAAIALGLIAVHRKRDVWSDIKSQVTCSYFIRWLWAVEDQDDAVGLNFVSNPTYLDASSVSDATQFFHHLLLQTTQ